MAAINSGPELYSNISSPETFDASKQFDAPKQTVTGASKKNCFGVTKKTAPQFFWGVESVSFKASSFFMKHRVFFETTPRSDDRIKTTQADSNNKINRAKITMPTRQKQPERTKTTRSGGLKQQCRSRRAVNVAWGRRLNPKFMILYHFNGGRHPNLWRGIFK